tara:strand:- start:441 stop:995 length:555 start_codon:yes stop_codon:yes gene_type:complete
MSEIRVDNFKAEDGISAPSFPNGIQVTGIVTSTVLDTSVSTLNVTGGHVNVGSNIQLGDAGIVTATSFIGNISGTTGTFSGAVSGSTGTFTGNVSVGGTLTYEDVTNIDSVGLVTARDGLIVTGVTTSTAADIDDFISVGSNIHLGNAGIITATAFVDDGTNLLTEINTKATTGKAIAMAMIFG